MIRDRKFFNDHLPANFDGEFEWDNLSLKVFPKFNNEDFMDVDGVMEKNNRFLHFETKSINSNIPMGQQITMRAYHSTGYVTYIILQFADVDKDTNKIDKLSVWYPNDEKPKHYDLKPLSYIQRFDLLVKIVKQWRLDAEKGGALSKKEFPKEVVIEKVMIPCDCLYCRIVNKLKSILK